MFWIASPMFSPVQIYSTHAGRTKMSKYQWYFANRTRTCFQSELTQNHSCLTKSNPLKVSRIGNAPTGLRISLRAETSSGGEICLLKCQASFITSHIECLSHNAAENFPTGSQHTFHARQRNHLNNTITRISTLSI